MEQSSTLLTTVIVPLATAVAAFIGGLVGAIFQAHGSIRAAQQQAQAAIQSAERQAAAAIASAEKQAEAAIRASSEASKSAADVVMLEHRTALERNDRAIEDRKRAVAAALMCELLAIRWVLLDLDKRYAGLEKFVEDCAKNPKTAHAQPPAPRGPKISTPIFDAHVGTIGLLEPNLAYKVALIYSLIATLRAIDPVDTTFTLHLYLASIKTFRARFTEILELIASVSPDLGKVAAVTADMPSH